MGGKGGGGGMGPETYDPVAYANQVYNMDPQGIGNTPEMGGRGNPYKQQFNSTRNQYINPSTGVWDEGAWRAAKGGGAANPFEARLFDLYFPAPPAPTPAPAPAPAPAAAAPPPTTPPPTTTPPPPVTPIDPGGSIDQPLGDQLGGALLNPPQYWIGDVNNYNKAKNTGNTSGAITTTQT